MSPTRNHRLLSSLAICSLLIFSGACSGPEAINGPGTIPEGYPCANKNDCASGLICYMELCHKSCLRDEDCKAASQHCGKDNVCVAGSNFGCGNGIREETEECDDGNMENGDGCSSICRIEAGYSCKENAHKKSTCTKSCGNGIREDGEECDDGNMENGDGCSSACHKENGYNCQENEQKTSVCEAICSDGIKVKSEECDDGNETNGDGCSTNCHIEDGFVCQESKAGCSLEAPFLA